MSASLVDRCHVDGAWTVRSTIARAFSTKLQSTFSPMSSSVQQTFGMVELDARYVGAGPASGIFLAIDQLCTTLF